MKITIGIVNYNRSKIMWKDRELLLLPNCIESIAKAAAFTPKDIDLLIVDFNSTDWPLIEWLPGKWPYHCKIISEDGPFSVGKGRNKILQAFNGDVLFLLDADMIVPVTFIARMAALALEGYVVFPQDTRYSNPEQTKTTVSVGYGNLIINKAVISQMLAKFKGKPYPESTSWGGEDVVMAGYIKKQKVAPIKRELIEGLYHQWHPKDGDYYKKPG